VQEARHVAKLAKEKKLVTQMGTQIHAGSNYRRVVEIIRAGTLGKVSEVYTWCNKGWSDGRFKEAGKPAPVHFDWDLWLGPAKSRPYMLNIHPENWRRFWEFGSGTFGDMACHIVDLPFWALDLRYPTAVSATGPEVHPDGAPSWCMCEYQFPGLKLFWSDGGKHHDTVAKLKDPAGKDLSSWGLGILFVGDKGMLAADYGRHYLFPKEQFAGFKPPEKSIPESIGHWNEWVQAIKTNGPTTCNFDYSGALTETVLLGVVAYRTGKPLTWDAAKLQTPGTPEAQRYVTKEYRKGFEIAGM
jgi:predicted dehydrogenase